MLKILELAGRRTVRVSGCRGDWRAPGAGYGVALWSFGGGKGLGEKAGRKVHSVGKK